ncbi:DUF6262 family protein [Microbacterium sp. KSW4-16]|uniref:DUF6262 family protein n=1 Tax=Microbacterium aurugineum TaxID=2851642 RepID=UPI0020BD7975|nr:DUF6262 family protein [Microbacterium aurugineum]MCK8468262.1 DUF6262 family protein [Microbacterium aurugineum]
MTPADNTAALLQARKRVSQDKRADVAAAIERLLATGIRITYSRVAREAGVSQGLVHDPDLKHLTTQAIEHQRVHGVEALPPATRPKPSVTPATRKAELSLTRDEISELRRTNQALIRRLGNVVGAELDVLAQSEEVARLRELEETNERLLTENDQLHRELSSALADVDTLRDDLSALRASYAKLMKRINGL